MGHGTPGATEKESKSPVLDIGRTSTGLGIVAGRMGKASENDGRRDPWSPTATHDLTDVTVFSIGDRDTRKSEVDLGKTARAPATSTPRQVRRSFRSKKRLRPLPSSGLPDDANRRPQIGDVVHIYWSDDDRYYRGKLFTRLAFATNMFLVLYDDGEWERVDLDNEKWYSEGRRTHP